MQCGLHVGRHGSIQYVSNMAKTSSQHHPRRFRSTPRKAVSSLPPKSCGFHMSNSSSHSWSNQTLVVITWFFSSCNENTWYKSKKILVFLVAVFSSGIPGHCTYMIHFVKECNIYEKRKIESISILQCFDWSIRLNMKVLTMLIDKASERGQRGFFFHWNKNLPTHHFRLPAYKKWHWSNSRSRHSIWDCQ